MALSSSTFSKTLSYLLRHHPEEFGVSLQGEGWAQLTEVAAGLTRVLGEPVTVEKLLRVAAKKADKQRFEVQGEAIRAVHGHTIALEEPTGVVLSPPAVLYHGTIHWALESILAKGLLPQKRQFVHLSETLAMAKDVGSRRQGRLVLLEVAAGEAAAAGVIFRRTTSTVWLVPTVPAKYLSVITP